jgi:hypothetical protein
LRRLFGSLECDGNGKIEGEQNQEYRFG